MCYHTIIQLIIFWHQIKFLSRKYIPKYEIQYTHYPLDLSQGPNTTLGLSYFFPKKVIESLCSIFPTIKVILSTRAQSFNTKKSYRVSVLNL